MGIETGIQVDSGQGHPSLNKKIVLAGFVTLAMMLPATCRDTRDVDQVIVNVVLASEK